MGKLFGAGKTTDIHEGPNLEFLQEGKKIRHGPVGVSDGENFNACVVGGFQEWGGLCSSPSELNLSITCGRRNTHPSQRVMSQRRYTATPTRSGAQGLPPDQVGWKLFSGVSDILSFHPVEQVPVSKGSHPAQSWSLLFQRPHGGTAFSV